MPTLTSYPTEVPVQTWPGYPPKGPPEGHGPLDATGEPTRDEAIATEPSNESLSEPTSPTWINVSYPEESRDEPLVLRGRRPRDRRDAFGEELDSWSGEGADFLLGFMSRHGAKFVWSTLATIAIGAVVALAKATNVYPRIGETWRTVQVQTLDTDNASNEASVRAGGNRLLAYASQRSTDYELVASSGCTDGDEETSCTYTHEQQATVMSIQKLRLVDQDGKDLVPPASDHAAQPRTSNSLRTASAPCPPPGTQVSAEVTVRNTDDPEWKNWRDWREKPVVKTFRTDPWIVVKCEGKPGPRMTDRQLEALGGR